MLRFVLPLLLLFSTSAPAQELVQFENGQVADANDINSNFQLLKNSIDILANIEYNGCSAQQQGSNVVISCADGSEGILASAGTVVTFLDGQIGEIDYTFNTGDKVVEDANGVRLGRYGGGDGGSSPQIPIVLEEDPLLVLVAANDTSSIAYPLGLSLFFESNDCTGAAFYNDNIGTHEVRKQGEKFYVYSGEQYSGKVVNSRGSEQSCDVKNEVLRRASLMQEYIPSAEMTNAAWPLSIVQLP